MTLCGCAQAIGGMHARWAGDRSEAMVVSDREREMRELAERLLFDINEQKARFTLTRTADVPARVRREDLTLSEAERFWKPRNCAAHKGG